jgi:hypothetical protein
MLQLHIRQQERQPKEITPNLVILNEPLHVWDQPKNKNITIAVQGVKQPITVRLISQVGLIQVDQRPPRTYKPRQPEIETWKINKVKNSSKEVQFQSAFDRLLNNYTKQRADSMNRPIKKEVRSPPKQIYVPKKEVLAAPMEGIKQKISYKLLYGSPN